MAANPSEVQSGWLRAVLTRLMAPADDWAQGQRWRTLNSLSLLMGAVLAVLAGAGLTGLALSSAGEEHRGTWLALFLALLIIGAVSMGVLMYQVNHHLLRPLAQLRTWAQSMCKGDLSSRIPLPQRGEFARLAHHINRLSDALERLANEMDQMVRSQTERLENKNRSLEVLYELAATVTRSRDLDDLLERSACKLMEVVGGRAATVRLRTEDGHMRLVKSIGLEATPAGGEPLAVDGNAFSEIQALIELHTPIAAEGVTLSDAGPQAESMGLVTIPLRYRGRNLGVYNIFTTTPEAAEIADIGKLLESVGQHLGMAIEKARLDRESKNLSIMRERTALAHELHDSLAQTLASLRFQVKILGEMLQGSDNLPAIREGERIQSSLDEAHTELRELLANFRAPVDDRGLLPAVEELISRFRRESGIAAYLHVDCADPQLSPALEMQVLRIVREALTNVSKHSGAQTVRVLLRCDGAGHYRVLIEDDGRGIGPPVLGGHPGEHVGLSIMEERARRLGGKLSIESEEGEGTRVLLTFDAPHPERGGAAHDSHVA